MNVDSTYIFSLLIITGEVIDIVFYLILRTPKMKITKFANLIDR